MSIFKNILGVMSNLFRIGGPSGPNIKNNSGVVEFRNTGDTAYTKARALQIQSSNSVNDIPVLLDLMGHIPLIEFSFNGASAPAAGTNTSKFGFCHTTGGSYTVGDVVFDDGTTLTKINFVRAVLTTSSFTGTISMNANGIYAGSGSSWTLKGDGSSTDIGFDKVISIPYTYSDTNKDSTTSIPADAIITGVKNKVTQAFNGTAPTCEIKVNGSTPLTIMATTENDLKTVGQYDNDEAVDVSSDNAGIVRVIVTPDSSSAGAGKAAIFYASPGA